MQHTSSHTSSHTTALTAHKHTLHPTDAAKIHLFTHYTQHTSFHSPFHTPLHSLHTHTLHPTTQQRHTSLSLLTTHITDSPLHSIHMHLFSNHYTQAHTTPYRHNKDTFLHSLYIRHVQSVVRYVYRVINVRNSCQINVTSIIIVIYTLVS